MDVKEEKELQIEDVRCEMWDVGFGTLSSLARRSREAKAAIIASCSLLLLNPQLSCGLPPFGRVPSFAIRNHFPMPHAPCSVLTYWLLDSLIGLRCGLPIPLYLERQEVVCHFYEEFFPGCPIMSAGHSKYLFR